MIESMIIIALAVFAILYFFKTGDSMYKFIVDTSANVYDKVAPYSFKSIRNKVKEMGLEYTPKQYVIQTVGFAAAAFGISYLYFYNPIISILYMIVVVSVIPYLTYLRCKRIYSEFIFEQIQVYTTNVIMEFATSQAFVKSLEGVYSSGVLEDPVKSDVKVMIDMSYANGTIDAALEYMNSKYDYFIVRNMHQIFLQITNEGSTDAGESLENMSQDIDMLVESVYRDRIDRASFYKKFVQFGIILYLMVMLIQFILGVETYIENLKQVYMIILLNIIVVINTCFLISGTKFYNENVGAE